MAGLSPAADTTLVWNGLDLLAAAANTSLAVRDRASLCSPPGVDSAAFHYLFTIFVNWTGAHRFGRVL